MALLDLPNELLVDIVTCLCDEQDIYAVALASRRLYDLSINHLYRVNDDYSEARAIIWAINHEQYETLHRALAAGVEIDFSALDAAATYGQTAMLELLLDHPSLQPDPFKKFGASLLASAVQNKHMDTVQFLIERGAPLNCGKEQVLHVASSQGSLEVVKLLLDRGVDVNMTATTYTKHRDTALMSAAVTNQVEIARLLLDSGARVDAVTSNGWSALHYAATYGNVSMIKLLADHGADINREGARGWRPLTLAITTKDKEPLAAKEILERGADHETNGNPEHLPLSLAVVAGMVEIVSMLLERGVETQARNAHGYTPLVTAIHRGHSEIVRLLLEYGVDADLKDDCECTPLHHAAGDGEAEIVRLLLSAGANILTDNFGSVPLHFAARAGSLEIFKLLVEHSIGATVAQSHDGATPTHIAAESGRWEILQFLSTQPGFNVDTKDYIGRTPLFYGARTGKFESVRELCELGADVTVKDHYGATAIFAAVRNGHLAATEALLKADPNCIDSRDQFGYNLIRWAAMGKHDHLLPILCERAKAVGLDVAQSDLDACARGIPFSPDNCSCDICMKCINSSTMADECTICCGGSFLRCDDCLFLDESHCLDETHRYPDQLRRHLDCSNCRT